MAPEQKTEKLLIRFGASELRMLTELSERSGLTKADVVRQLIRKEHVTVFGETPAKPRRKK